MKTTRSKLVILIAFSMIVTIVIAYNHEGLKKTDALSNTLVKKEALPKSQEKSNVLPGTSDKSEQCVTCHGASGNGKSIVKQWQGSAHAENGISCLDCHATDSTSADAFKHYGEMISTIVTPLRCSVCHEKEYTEFSKSHHADGGMILGSLDNVLAEIVEGSLSFNGGANPTAASGCWQCHGSKIEVLKDANGKSKKDSNGVVMYAANTWPNTGIGRINLDGSKGSCSACHNRHSFSVEQARQPENCGKCHMGPDHPQEEIYNESKHGINYNAFKDSMNLNSKTWITGVDNIIAPTCASCHMSATPDMSVTHDVGDRISWTLRPAVSQKIDAALLAKYKKEGKAIPAGFLTWEKRRAKMKNVCAQCHTTNYVSNFYTQYDNVVNIYNEKYGTPTTNFIKLLKAEKLLTEIDFDEEIEWTYYYLWHHEGRRARMGASMMGPDYTQWHGFFEVAGRFYTEFVPQAKELIEEAVKDGKTVSAKKAEDALNEILNSEMHKWSTGKIDSLELQKRKANAKSFRERYEK